MIKNLQNNKGFVILFAITISSILLAIALGVSNIALKQVKFGTNARDTNNAFFAADTGVERALFLDKPPGIICDPAPCTFAISGLGSSAQSCVKVSITKTSELTTIISKGYNIGDAPLCDSTNPDRVERELKVTY
ncbi:MAG: pilus assembly PilX N-terminal domain-containing protein [Candidatus Paceibacterota bacterium]